MAYNFQSRDTKKSYKQNPKFYNSILTARSRNPSYYVDKINRNLNKSARTRKTSNL